MNPLHRLLEHGQSYWLDNLTRDKIASGELERRVTEEGLRGVTSNPAIFRKAIGGGGAYDDQIERLVSRRRSIREIYEEVVVTDIRDACDVLRPVWEDSDGADGYVSLEVSPHLARATGPTIEEARRLHAAVDRPNVLIKIPGTEEGLPAIEECLFEGININITLLFSVDRYERVAEAYVRALERRLEAGETVHEVASVASFFLSRIDVLVDRLLAHRIRTDDDPRPEELVGEVAVANAKEAYRRFREIFSGDRWRRLADEGARVQRVLWASTSTKDPLYSDVRYVEPLIGPDTVNTLPDRTISAFADHGRVAETIEEDLEDARRTLDDLAAVGIDLERVTDQLEDEGIQKFIDPFDELMGTLAERRQRFLGAHRVSQEIHDGDGAPDIEGALASLDRRRFGRRLHARDPRLWTSDPERMESIRQRLGWLDCPDSFRGRIFGIREFADEARREFDDVVLLGMGGSSLCADVCRRVFGPARGYPRFTVLDDTDPAAVRATAADVDLQRTLFVVASKSGTTTETLSLYRTFRRRMAESGVEDPGSRFVAITDPGTPLAEEAREVGFQECFENPSDIGGRYSALSYFGLVPMALLGIDPDHVLESAAQMLVSCEPVVPARHDPGIRLGTSLGMWARAGRDKVTMSFSGSIEPLGDWLEQLLAESTGKEGTGLVPVLGEPLAEPGDYGDDRLFVHVSVAGDDGGHLGEGAGQTARSLEALERAGHPVVRIEIADRHGLGAEFVHWEIATATAGAILGIDAFDEPDVEASKRKTRELLRRWHEEGSLPSTEPLATVGDLQIHAPEGVPGAPTPRSPSIASDAGPDEMFARILEGFLETADRRDYLALLAFFHRSPERQAAVEELRAALRDRLGVATTVGYGPRYLHSTGQLHKGGPDTGLFLILTAEDNDGDILIPGSEHGFRVLHRAQALGDFLALAERGRRVLRVHLGDDIEAGLGRLAAAAASVTAARDRV